MKNLRTAGAGSGADGCPDARRPAVPAGAAAERAVPADARGALSAQARSERGTRARVARLILELGPSTASVIGGRLGLTPAAIRRHLDNLLAEGLIETRTARTYGSRGRGRPARLFAITDAGRSAFEHAYDDLATSALRFLAETGGPAAVEEFARRQVAELERKYGPAVAAAGPGARVKALADVLSADGYAASAHASPTAGEEGGPGTAQGAPPPAGGEQLCQHHCPVAHVAAEFPQLCEAETEAFSRLLGTPVQRLATIAHGDGICTTHVTDRTLMAGGPGGLSGPGGHGRGDDGGKQPVPGKQGPRGSVREPMNTHGETISGSGGLFL